MNRKPPAGQIPSGALPIGELVRKYGTTLITWTMAVKMDFGGDKVGRRYTHVRETINKFGMLFITS